MKRLREQRRVAGLSMVLLAVGVVLCASRVVIATDDAPGIGCPHRVVELAATVHYEMTGEYPVTLAQMSNDGFDPPNLSADGLVATTDWWTLRMDGNAPPMFHCD